ncbi:MAG: invasion associated locus B family protein [Siculibacillus sp.]|nr:invasion associated locus B family protein [Siculibacillus sp.]
MVVRFIRATVPTFEAGLARAAVVAGALSSVLILAPAPVVAQDAGKPVQLAPKPAPQAAPKPATPTAPAAQKPTPAAPKAAAAAPPVPEDAYPWVKICQKDAEGKSVCLIAKELRGGNGELIASVAMRDTEGEPKKTLLIAVPPGVLIQPGMRVMIDKGKPVEVKYRICFPNACYADLDLTDQMSGDLKKGNLLIVTALTLQQKPTGYPFRLDTFKAALESQGVDPTSGQQSQEQLQQELQKRAEEAAKKLQSGAAPKP